MLQKYGTYIGVLDDLTAVAIIIIVTVVLKFVFSKLIDKLFSDNRTFFKSRIDPSRRATIKGITKNAVKYLLYFIALMVILSQFINISSILTIAGIGGIILSLGLKSMIEDVVAGFFIIFEDQYNVGDYITIDKYSGVVESIGIRTTTIADFNGDLHSIHNGSITVITNHSRKDQRVMFDIGIDYESDVAQAEYAIKEVCKSASTDDRFTDGPYSLGVQQISSTGVTFRIYATTRCMAQWDAERYLKHQMLERFRKDGIRMEQNTNMTVQKKVTE